MKEADWTDPSNPIFSGTTADTPTTVLESFTAYYTALFAKKATNSADENICLATLADPRGQRVLAPTATKCDADITKEEIEEVINALPSGKSPGPDRLPTRFYKTFSLQLVNILPKVFNESRDTGRLPDSCREGLISVLHKKGTREDPRMYRPITLLNCDYKILTRVLTQRMNEAVLQFVSPCQNGFVPGGFIAENLMLLNLIKAYVEEEREDAFFLFLDMEKAFDRCSWDYLTKALTQLGFGDGFVNYVKLFYSHANPPTRKININGRLGESFPLASGVAQGCPLSPLLFLVVTEALSRLITNDTNIKGVQVHGTHHKISQYADDSTLIGTPSDAPRFETHIRTWCGATAMRENNTNREGLLIGSLRAHPEKSPGERGRQMDPERSTHQSPRGPHRK